MKKVENPYRDQEGYYCFGCAEKNAFGLKLEFYEDGEYLVCTWEPKDHFQGWRNILHGGIQATLMDEIASWVIFAKLNRGGFTSKMEVRYRKPVSVKNKLLTVKAKLAEMKRNLAFIDAWLYDENGELCAESRFQYFTLDHEETKSKLL